LLILRIVRCSISHRYNLENTINSNGAGFLNFVHHSVFWSFFFYKTR
jgi:hypothetical protein